MLVLILGSLLLPDVTKQLAPRIIVRDQPTHKVICTFDIEGYRGPMLVSRVHVEYDNGKFRETTLTRSGRPSQVRVYDRNSQRICYTYITGSRHRTCGLDLDSYMYRLALYSPAEYFKANRIRPSETITLGSPWCRFPKRAEASQLQHLRKIGREKIGDKLCDVYELGPSNSGERIKTWSGWVIEEESAMRGTRERITSISFHKSRLPATTFSLPRGSKISAPKFAKVKPPPGIALKEFEGIHDSPSVLPKKAKSER